MIQLLACESGGLLTSATVAFGWSPLIAKATRASRDGSKVPTFDSACQSCFLKKVGYQFVESQLRTCT